MLDTSGIVSLLDKVESWRRVGKDSKALRRLLMLEANINVAMLDSLRLTNKDVAQDDPAFIAVAGELRSDALEAILAIGPEATKALEELSDLRFSLRGDDRQHGDDAQPVLGEKLLRLYVRVVSLRNLVGIYERHHVDGNGAMKRLNFKLRLRHLRTDFAKVAATLRAA